MRTAFFSSAGLDMRVRKLCMVCQNAAQQRAGRRKRTHQSIIINPLVGPTFRTAKDTMSHPKAAWLSWVTRLGIQILSWKWVSNINNLFIINASTTTHQHEMNSVWLTHWSQSLEVVYSLVLTSWPARWTHIRALVKIFPLLYLCFSHNQMIALFW